MTSPVLPLPTVPIVAKQTGMMNDPWYRFFQQSNVGGATDLAAVQSDISALQGQVSTLQGQMTTVQGQITTIQGQITALQAQTAAIGTVLLTSGTIPNLTSLDIVLTAYTAYRGLIFEVEAIPATDGANFTVRFSTNGGLNYDVSGYSWANGGSTDSSAAYSGGGNGSDTAITIVSSIGNGSAEGLITTVQMLQQTSTALWTKLAHQSYYIDNQATPTANFRVGGGSREAAQDTDAIRFIFSAGNIASGNYAVYGLQ